jgi:uncharacterized repeat protein (TIGR03803 family)
MKVFTHYLHMAILQCCLIAFISFPLRGTAAVYYGLASAGGDNNKGAIISFNSITNTESVVWSFDGTPIDGSLPNGNLVFDPANGLFYALTSSGGLYDLGAIISFNPKTNAENLVWSFGNSTDGSYPNGNLLYDAGTGLFFGLTAGGGNNGAGTIISFNPGNNSETVLWSFGSDSDGANPYGSLIYDEANSLYYGMAQNGGSNTFGCIFSFNAANDSESVVWSFGTVPDAQHPSGDLIYNVADTLLYGLTEKGGVNNAGAIISFNPATGKDSVVWNFGSGTDGAGPAGNLVTGANNGLYYALTQNGGVYNNGALISFNPTANTDSVLWSFAGDSSDGGTPAGNPVYDADYGVFFILTQYGGINNEGALASYSLAKGTDSLFWSFGSDSDAAFPLGSLVLLPAFSDILTDINTSFAVKLFPDPNNGIFNISGLAAGQKIEVYDFTGQLISSIATQDFIQPIDISAQENGIYIIRILGNDGITDQSIKVIKAD